MEAWRAVTEGVFIGAEDSVVLGTGSLEEVRGTCGGGGTPSPGSWGCGIIPRR